MSNITSIKQLSQVLQHNGDQVLDGSSKLTLTADLINTLNERFNVFNKSPNHDSIMSSFQVLSTSNNSGLELIRDLQFLHDFVQKIIGLKLIDLGSSASYPIDLTRFKSLKLLEIRHVDVRLVGGLKNLRSQINCLICSKCLGSLGDLLISCGSDDSGGFIWNDLTEAVFSYNSITKIDNSFDYTPYLQMLDLSHNKLTDTTALNCLSNLKHLNIGYNKFDSVPLFSQELCHSLLTLILKANYIEDLTNVVLLKNLSELDVSCNCIVEISKLGSLSYMHNLKWLSLEGNPLTYHPRYRLLAVKHLHANTASVKFTLDEKPLTRSECLQVGTRAINAMKLPEQIRESMHNSLNHSVSSHILADIVVAGTGEIVNSSNNIVKNRPTKKSNRVRQAFISESDTIGVTPTNMNESFMNATFSEESADHLEMKKQIEELQKRFGSDWLHSISGSQLQDVLGMEKQIPVINAQISIAAQAWAPPTKPTFDTSVTANQNGRINNTSDALTDSGDLTFTTAVSDISTLDSTLFSQNREVNQFGEMSQSIRSEKIESYYEDETPFIVESLKLKTEIFVCVSESADTIRERDVLTGKQIERWQLSTLMSCESQTGGKIRLTFDTLKRDKQTRDYASCNDDEFRSLVELLSQMLSARPLNEMNHKIYKCMRCSTEFSCDVNARVKRSIKADVDEMELLCPCCKEATVVIEIDEEKFPAMVGSFKNNIGDSPTGKEETLMPHSSSHTIATKGVEAISRTSSDPPIHLGSLDSNYQMRTNNDSDNELLSNPSQGSIEVLTPFDSQRNANQCPNSLNSIENKNLSVNLTESISSGSIADSVSMAIRSKPEDLPPKTASPVVAGGLSSMLEGLLSGATKMVFAANDYQPIEKINVLDGFEFSYTDFRQVDHRIKLHVFVDIFEENDEDLVWLVKGKLLMSHESQPYDGCLLLSNCKLYLLKIDSHCSSEEPSKWLIKLQSFAAHRFKTVFTLPWKQGVGFELRSDSFMSSANVYILCLFQDLLRTSNFLTFLSSSTLPQNCELKSITLEQAQLVIQHMLLTKSVTVNDDDDAVTLRIFCIFDRFAVNDDKPFKMGALLVTNSDVMVSTDELTWMVPNIDANYKPNVYKVQHLRDLVQIDCCELTLVLNFLDESVNEEEKWTMQLATKHTLESVVNAMSVPWQELFAVPLQVNYVQAL